MGFSLTTLIISLILLLFSQVLRRIGWNSICSFTDKAHHPPPVFFQKFSFIFAYRLPLAFILLVLWASWIIIRYLTLNQGKFSVIIASNISSVPFSFFSVWYSHYTYIILLWFSHWSWIFCSFVFQSFFSLLSVLEVSINISSSSQILSSTVSNLVVKPVKGILHFCYSIFNPQHLFFIMS